MGMRENARQGGQKQAMSSLEQVGLFRYSQHGKSVMLEASEIQGHNLLAGIGMALCNRLRILLAK